MPYKFAMTDVPTYPFQRLYNYPSYICSRASLLLPYSIKWKPPSKKRPLLDSSSISLSAISSTFTESRVVAFFRRCNGRFLRPCSGVQVCEEYQIPHTVVLETPELKSAPKSTIKAPINWFRKMVRHVYLLGTIADKPGSSLGRKVVKEPEMVPLQMMSKAQIYECFKNVQFGEPFRTVQEVRIWADHADADIKLQATENPAHDRIRKLDACLHMFGAISSRMAPPVDDSAGAYLPASLEDFTLHTDDMPYNFTCRYYLPLDIGRNARVLSSCFEVFSDAGDLLVSCKKYSVAWVPRGVVHKEQKPAETNANTWLRNGWTPQPLPAPQTTSVHRFDELLYLGNGQSSRVLHALSPSAKDCISVEIPHLSHDKPTNSVAKNVKTFACEELNKLPSLVRGQDMLVVLDLSKANSSPGSKEFTSLYLQILMFMKLVMAHKLHIRSFLALTSWSAPVDLYKEGLDLFSDSNVASSSLVGAIMQGMIRVFRRETGLDFAAWCLDLANVDNLTDSTLRHILTNEVQARHQSTFSDTFVSYREDAAKKSLSRLVPALESLEQVPARSPSGTTVIVGMGSIGSALAISLIEAGCDSVIFLGRRPDSQDKVIKELSALPEKVKTRCQYRQVDVCDREALKNALADINRIQGRINNIIHTAAVVTDSTIAATKPTDFEAVLRPKVVGSWNLHVVSQELNLNLESFVLCSSTNVIVGNPGQVAYVAANSFMDSLATFRHNSGMPGTSLQLGAWESKLIGEIDMKGSFALLMKNEEGLPLILKAMMAPIPLQIIARMDATKLAATPAYAKDPFFAPLLASPNSADTTPSKAKLSAEQANKILIDILRVALELQPSEKLDTAEELTSLGADSITFAQFKGQVLKEFQVDVPMIYLSDGYTISDMINNVLESYGAA
ncbi:KR domain-containing protein [Pholiota molesta]|nr:KR domain-containing protein [Pholiota molesta]